MRSFAVAGPHIWNSLPAALRTATLSPLAFARHLKTHLFDWDWQRVWGLFRTRSTNLRIIIIIIINLEIRSIWKMLDPFATASRFTLSFTRCCYCRHCRTPPAHQCPRRRWRRRQRVTEGTAMAPWNGPNECMPLTGNSAQARPTTAVLTWDVGSAPQCNSSDQQELSSLLTTDCKHSVIKTNNNSWPSTIHPCYISYTSTSTVVPGPHRH